MSVKILVLFVCMAVGTGTGFAVMLSYKKNYAYFSGLCDMIEHLKRNISYRRDSAATAMGAFECDSSLLKKNIQEYISYAGGAQELVLSKGFLRDENYGKVRELFSSIGRSDGNTQLDELKMYSATFCKIKSVAEQKYNKYGTAAVKLGFLFGLLSGVLIL